MNMYKTTKAILRTGILYSFLYVHNRSFVNRMNHSVRGEGEPLRGTGARF